MMLKRRKVEGGGVGGCGHHPKPVVTTKSRLFAPGRKLVVCRAPLMMGLGISSSSSGGGGDALSKRFQRPMLKRRAYGARAEQALQSSSLGPRRRMDGMAKLLARAGRGLSFQLPANKKSTSDTEDSDSGSDDEKEADRPFEPLCVWKSPHPQPKLLTTSDENHNNNDANNNKDDVDDDVVVVEPKGLPPTPREVTRVDEFGLEETVTVLQPAPIAAYAKQHVLVPPVLAKWLRPHQREGVQFLYECVMGLKDYRGRGCILADDMGLGKTLQSVTLIYTLLKTGITANNAPTAKRVIVICPCSLVKNWENEFIKWLGPGVVKCLALAEADRKTVERNLDTFVRTKIFNVLIASYECIRTHYKRLIKHADCCDLLVCDEAHRLKNSDNQTSRALNALPVTRRVLLTGTPMQNDLQEFYAMVDFTNPGILGTPEEFRRNSLFPILRGREPDATDAQRNRMMKIQNDMSTIVNDFILRRINTLNAEHLPPKLVQVVCCKLTDMQQNMYQHLVTSKDTQHVLDGKQVNCLSSIQMLMKLANHPSLVANNNDDSHNNTSKSRRGGGATVKYHEHDNAPSTAAPGAEGMAKFLPYAPPGRGGGRSGDFAPVFPEWSGKMFVLFRLMREMRKPGNGNDKIVIVSNYTQTLDLIGRMCRENSWGFCRLDGSINMKKRQKMCDDFNDPNSSLVAFLLSSKAGGCGLNLIGGNRLVLFDPDWNPAVDKQAAARCWRDGQKKRCFTYRFLATGTVEEKIFQRQLSKEGLQSVVDDKEQTNHLSSKDLKNLFKLRTGTPSDTHDKLRCERCKIIHDNAELQAQQVLPCKLAACAELLQVIMGDDNARFFLQPLIASDHGRTKDEYERIVKQPMDLGTIRNKLQLEAGKPAAYTSCSAFSKDVNRIFSNILKVWSPGDEIADAARRLQATWIEAWTALVPRLMNMKADDVGGNENDETASSHDEQQTDGNELVLAATNNERGEDYQEQIGMPDEENMRHWSHHYSTDTVDDPIFRAAMRGYDSVSFVFGLEVTWSLIQQRQQEEEERLAMEEMEQCGAATTNDSDDEEEKEEGSPPPADASKDSDVEEDAAIEEVGVQQVANLNDSSDEEQDDDIPVGESGDCDSGATKAEVVNESKAACLQLEDSDDDDESKAAACLQLGDPDDDESDVVANTASSTQSDSSEDDESVVAKAVNTSSKPLSFSEDSDEDEPPAKTPKQKVFAFESSSEEESPPRPSTVERRAFLEDSDEDSLDLSGNRPKANEPVMDESPQTAFAVEKENESSVTSAPSSSEWECPACTLHNAKSEATCTVCGTKKPRASRKRKAS